MESKISITAEQTNKMDQRVYSQPLTTRLAMALADGHLKYPRMKTIFPKCCGRSAAMRGAAMSPRRVGKTQEWLFLIWSVPSPCA